MLPGGLFQAADALARVHDGGQRGLGIAGVLVAHPGDVELDRQHAPIEPRQHNTMFGPGGADASKQLQDRGSS